MMDKSKQISIEVPCELAKVSPASLLMHKTFNLENITDTALLLKQSTSRCETKKNLLQLHLWKNIFVTKKQDLIHLLLQSNGFLIRIEHVPSHPYH